MVLKTIDILSALSLQEHLIFLSTITLLTKVMSTKSSAATIDLPDIDGALNQLQIPWTDCKYLNL